MTKKNTNFCNLDAWKYPIFPVFPFFQWGGGVVASMTPWCSPWSFPFLKLSIEVLKHHTLSINVFWSFLALGLFSVVNQYLLDFQGMIWENFQFRIFFIRSFKTVYIMNRPNTIFYWWQLCFWAKEAYTLLNRGLSLNQDKFQPILWTNSL